MADTRTIRTVLEMNVSRFQAGAAVAASSAKKMARELDEVSKAGSKIRADYDKVGTSMLGAGAAVAAGLGLTVKAAMDWESAWAGVRKTVNGSDAEMAALEGELRNLARTLPGTHQDIAAVAEAAGQLGIQRENVAEFTKTMIDLGESTNLTADEAATSLARFSNIMGTSTDDVDRLGATLVGLGNNFATTEAEIMAMSMRLAGTGRQMNMTEGDVMGVAAAMSSVGIEAEAGGTAMSTVLKKMDAAVREGGDSLSAFADISGVSAQEFANAWRSDPSSALVMFTAGLDKLGKSGESVSQVLGDLGIKGIREQDTMLRLAGAHEVLAKAVASGNQEFLKNTALLNEANKRYATTESQMKIAVNNITDAGIEIGGTLLPLLADVAGGVADAASAFGNLPDPVKSSVAQFSALGAAGLIAVGGLMKIVPAARDTIASFKSLQAEAPKAAKGVKLLGTALGAAGLIATLNSVGQAMTDFNVGIEEMSVKTTALADSATPIKDLFQGMHPEGLKEGKEFADYLTRLADPGLIGNIDNLTANVNNLVGIKSSGWDDEAARVKQYGESLMNLAEVDLPAAQESFKRLFEATGNNREATGKLIELMPAFKDHLIGLADANGLATNNATLLSIALGETTVNAEAAKAGAAGATEELTQFEQVTQDAATALEDLNDAMQQTGNNFLSVRASGREWNEVMAEMASGKHKKAWEDGTKAAKENAVQMDENAEKALDYIDALSATGELSSGQLSQIRQELIDQAVQLGATKEEAELYVDSLGLIPENVNTLASIETEEAQGKIDAYTAKFGETPPSVVTEVWLDSRTAETSMDSLQQGLYTMDHTTAAPGVSVQGVEGSTADVQAFNAELQKLPPVIQTIVTADTDPAKMSVEDVEALFNNIPDLQVYSDINLEGMETKANRADLRIAGLNAKEIKPFADLDDDQMIRSLQAAKTRLDELDQMKPTPSVQAEKKVLERVVRSAKGDLASIPDEKIAKVIGKTSGTGAVKELRDAVNSVDSKTVTVTARTAGMNAIRAMKSMMSGLAYGGWVPGLAAGGWVPGTYPGVGKDNVLWPLQGRAGGGYLAQPLAGGEFVMPTVRARQYAGELEAMRAGSYQPSRGGATLAPTFHNYGPDAHAVADRAMSQLRHEARGMAITTN